MPLVPVNKFSRLYDMIEQTLSKLFEYLPSKIFQTGDLHVFTPHLGHFHIKVLRPDL